MQHFAMRGKAAPAVRRDTAGVRQMVHMLPADAQLYLAHTEGGLSMRSLARAKGCHVSTVMRQIRKVEDRRDDVLVDCGLRRLGKLTRSGTNESHFPERKDPEMSLFETLTPQSPDPAVMQKMRPVLQRLAEPNRVLAVALEMEKAVVVDPSDSGRSKLTIARDLVEVMAINGWIECKKQGRVSRYSITSSGRSKAQEVDPGFAEAPTPFHGALPVTLTPEQRQRAARRAAHGETPLAILARRRGRDGRPFLSAGLVAAGERLREDFELARVPSDLCGRAEGGREVWNPLEALDMTSVLPAPRSNFPQGPDAAKARVMAALRQLGPGLADVALRCCCYLEGLERAERRMGWSARSGKVVLRIALERLDAHYAAEQADDVLIG